MKRTIITTVAAVAAVLAAAYLTGADGTSTGARQQTPTPAQQSMQEPMTETMDCEEGYILLMPCPVCHTCPVCQANCGTAHALRCCLGNRKQTTGTGCEATSGMPKQQHIMTNKATAVKHAAERTASGTAPMEEGELSILTIETN